MLLAGAPAGKSEPVTGPAPTVGVEEELFVVDADTGRLRGDARAIVASAEHRDEDTIDRELSRAQVETGSAVCATLAEVRASLTSLRRRLDVAARAHGARVLATGTHPSSPWQDAGGVTPHAAYLQLADDYGLLTDEQVVSGCHVHVGVPDPEMAIQVMNRVRLDVPILLALSGNSPFWAGVDTRYASYRTEVFHRWPTAGLPEPFASRAEYDGLVSLLQATSAIDAPARLYWDVRPSARYPTLEFRVADVPVTVGESVTLAGLCRALVVTAEAAVRAGEPAPVPRPEVLRAALWRAARFGLSGELVDLAAAQARPAPLVVEDLLRRLRPALEGLGDAPDVEAGVACLLEHGTGAERQRRAHARRDRLEDVVDVLVETTVP